MKYQVKRFIRKCDKAGCNKEIYDFEEYKNVCFICHKDFCNEHIILCCRFDDPTEKFAICDDCFNKLSDNFEQYIAENINE